MSEGQTNFEAHTDLGWTPLQLAAEAGSYHAVCSLIKAGAEVNSIERSHGRTALHIAVEGGHRDIVEYLLKNVRMNFIKYASFPYKKSYHINTIMFLQTKIDVNKKNFSGNTALHNAVVTQGAKAKELCVLLLKNGANPHIKNNNRPDNV